MLNKVKVFEIKPADFDGKVDVAAAYLEVDGKMLLLQLSEKKEYSGCWGVPAGKLEIGETPEQALLRELFEETGMGLSKEDQIHYLGPLFVRNPKVDFVYHPFKVNLKNAPSQITLSDEHSSYRWVSIEDAKKLRLIDGAEEALDFYVTQAQQIVQIVDPLS